MSSVPVYVGLDYHQDAVQVCVLKPSGEVLVNRPCRSDAAVIATLVSRHGQVVGAAIEACVGAATLAEELVLQHGWSVDLAHPGYVKRMKQNPDKTDFSDARVLADLERVGYLPKVWMAPEEIRELRRLVRYRFQLTARRRNLKLSIRGKLRDLRVRCLTHRPWTQGWLHWLRTTKELSASTQWIVRDELRQIRSLEASIASIEKRLERMTRNDPVVAALCAQRGVGRVTAWTLRAEIGRFDRFRTGKQLARFCGLSPRNASSGARQADAGLIQAGNPHARLVLIELAHRLVRYDAEWQAFAQRMRAKGKPTCVIIAAVANRWVRRLFHRLEPVTPSADHDGTEVPTAA